MSLIFFFEGDEHLSGAFFQIEVNLFVLRNSLLLLQLGDIQHTANQTAQTLGLIGDDVQVMLLMLRRDGAVQNPVHIAGNGGHGGLQLMGHVGDKFLPLIFALLQGRGHIVEGQSQLLHFLTGILVDFHPGIQLSVAEGGGGVGKLLQWLTFPPGKGGNAQHGHQHHKDGGGGENIADFVQNHPGSRGGGGDP